MPDTHLRKSKIVSISKYWKWRFSLYNFTFYENAKSFRKYKLLIYLQSWLQSMDQIFDKQNEVKDGMEWTRHCGPSWRRGICKTPAYRTDKHSRLEVYNDLTWKENWTWKKMNDNTLLLKRQNLFQNETEHSILVWVPSFFSLPSLLEEINGRSVATCCYIVAVLTSGNINPLSCSRTACWTSFTEI